MERSGIELKRIRAGRGTDLELEEDDEVWAVFGNAGYIQAKHVELQELDEAAASSSSGGLSGEIRVSQMSLILLT
jgi:hypothetical protein